MNNERLLEAITLLKRERPVTPARSSSTGGGWTFLGLPVTDDIRIWALAGLVLGSVLTANANKHKRS